MTKPLRNPFYVQTRRSLSQHVARKGQERQGMTVTRVNVVPNGGIRLQLCSYFYYMSHNQVYCDCQIGQLLGTLGHPYGEDNKFVANLGKAL